MAIASLSLLLLLVSVGILCAADINVTIKEWDTPGQNAGPHETEVAKLAHIDRATFEIKEYLLPEGARPAVRICVRTRFSRCPTESFGTVSRT